MSELMSILVPGSVRSEVEAEASETSATLQALRDWPCETAEDEKDLADVLAHIKGKAKVLEVQRKGITQPLDAARKAVNALFKAASTPLATAEAIIKNKLAQADKRREDARRKALALAQEAAAQARDAADAGDMETAREASQVAALAVHSAPVVGSTSAPEGVSFRYEWEWDLEDIGQVPVEFLALNPASMKMYVGKYRGSETIPDVPGVAFKRKRIVVSRTY